MGMDMDVDSTYTRGGVTTHSTRTQHTHPEGDALETFLVLHLSWLFVGKITNLQPDADVKYFLESVSNTDSLACLGAKC